MSLSPRIERLPRLALRQAEGLIGSVIGLLGLALRAPDHSTLSRRAATLQVPRSSRSAAGAGGEGEPDTHMPRRERSA